MGEPDKYDIEDYKEAQRLAFLGKYVESEKLIESKISRYNVGSYAPLGDLYIKIGEGEIEDIVRTLDIKNAVASASFTVDGKRISTTTIASNPDEVIAQSAESDVPANAVISLVTAHSATYEYCADEISMSFRCAHCSQGQTRPGRTHPRRYLEETDKGILAYAKVKVITDGKLSSSDGKIYVNGFKKLLVYLSASTSFKDGYEEGNPGYKSDVERIIDSVSKQSFTNILEKHIKDFTSYTDRCEIHFDGDAVDEATSTSQRFIDFRSGKKDFALVALMFNFGKYLLVSGSREDTAPTNLQGIWNESMTPPWASDYHLNINTQMNYWPALSMGLPELIQPIEWLLDLSSRTGREVAQKVYGARGFCVHHNLDIFGTAYPTPGMACWSYFPVSAGWLAREVYKKYEYTLDKAYLRREYHIFRGIAEFFMDMLVDDGEGYMILSPGTSPENLFYVGENTCAVAKSSTMFASIVRESLDNFVKASGILGVDDELTARVKEVLPRLLPLRITEDGRVEEWYFGKDAALPKEEDIHHRHISHLYDLYPGELINEDAPQLFEAAKESMRVRGDDATGWSFGWKMNCKARLGDGEGIMDLIKLFFRQVDPKETNTLAGGGIYTNLFCAHPPFQIDGNFGFAAAICEMLVGQKPNGEVKILPALPSELKSGYAKGIALKGNKKIDLAWADGKVTEYKIY
jgi:alpha-L-fucosidase 2